MIVNARAQQIDASGVTLPDEAVSLLVERGQDAQALGEITHLTGTVRGQFGDAVPTDDRYGLRIGQRVSAEGHLVCGV